MERLLLLSVLPSEGDITTLRLIRSLRESLSFNEAEHEALQFKGDGTRVEWNEAAALAAGPKQIEIGKKTLSMIADALKKLSEAGRLTLQHVDLYARFVQDEE